VIPANPRAPVVVLCTLMDARRLSDPSLKLTVMFPARRVPLISLSQISPPAEKTLPVLNVITMELPEFQLPTALNPESGNTPKPDVGAVIVYPMDGVPPDPVTLATGEMTASGVVEKLLENEPAGKEDSNVVRFVNVVGAARAGMTEPASKQNAAARRRRVRAVDIFISGGFFCFRQGLKFVE